MKKSNRYIVLLGLLLAVIPAWSRQRNMDEVRSIVRNAWTKNFGANNKKNLQTAENFVMLKSSDLLPSVSQEAFYVCMPDGAQTGYAIVSADDRMPAVLALSDESGFPENDIPVNMQEMMQEYSDALMAIEKGEVTPQEVFFPQNLDASVVVEPLLGGILYNQGNPYNLQCPVLKTGKYAATGCVATAFAQIMRYYQWPVGYGSGQNSYTSTTSTDTIKIDYDFSKTKFDWDNMMVAYARKHVDYTGGGSRTEDESQNFLTYISVFHYNGYTMRVDSLMCHNTSTNFKGKVQMILTDKDGNFLQPVGDARSISSWKKGSGSTTYNLTFSMPASYADGNYRLYVGTQYNNSGEWYYVKKAPSWQYWDNSSYHCENYLSVVKRGLNFYIGDEEFCCEYDDANVQAVAELMAACGASVNMVYGSSSSASTSLVPTAAATYFGYDKDAFYVSQTWFSQEDWHSRIQEELVAKRPILMRGSSSSGGGHAFVFDGVKYVKDVPYYHVNWGWSGSGNGYFLMTMLKPSEAGTGGSSTNYSNSNAMVLNLQPDDGVDNGYVLGCKGISVDDTTYVLPGGKFTVTLTSMQNIGQEVYAGTMSLSLLDKDGKSVSSLSCYNTSGLKPGYYYSEKTVEFQLPSVIPLGDYKLTVSGQAKDGKKCQVYCPNTCAIHVVAENPADTMPGLLRYTFNNEANTAKVRRFSLNSSINIQQYKGEIVIPDTVEYKGKLYEVTAIGDSAFYGCTDLTGLTMTSHIKSIGKHAFEGTSSLETIALSDSLVSMDLYAFADCGLQEIVIPASVTSIGNYAFYKNGKLKSVVLPDSLTTIGAFCFRECTALETIKLPSSLKRMPNYAFYGCTALKMVTIPASVTSILIQAFKGCTSLQAIYSHGTSPAKLSSKVFDETNNCPIYVLAECVDTYKSSWSAYASRIVADVTGINGVPVKENNVFGKVYDLTGKAVRTEEIQKGHIYIIENKKVLIK